MSGDSKTNQTPGCLGTACGAEVKFKIVFKTQTKWSSGWGKELPCFGPSELCDAWASRKDGKRKKKSGYNFRFSGPSLSSRKGLCTNQLIPVLLHGKHLQTFRGCQIHFLKDSHCVITPWARCPHCWCPWREDCRDVMLWVYPKARRCAVLSPPWAENHTHESKRRGTFSSVWCHLPEWNTDSELVKTSTLPDLLFTSSWTSWGKGNKKLKGLRISTWGQLLG